MITAELLARIFSEEFERDSWGDIDSHWFAQNGISDQEFAKNYKETGSDARALRRLLKRVAKKLNAATEKV
jgi:uncharacterized protein YukE